MCRVTINLIKFVSLVPEKDLLAKWMCDLGFFDQDVKTILREYNNLLPVPTETVFRERFGLPLAESTKVLFNKLLHSNNEIPLVTLGLTRTSWKDPETCTYTLNHLKLCHVQDESLLKANKIAFDERVKYLVGVLSSPPS